MPIWDAIVAEYMRIFQEEGIPESPNISALADRLFDWANAQGLTNVPEPKTIRERLRTWLSRLNTPDLD
jgi:hypothetical protein